MSKRDLLNRIKSLNLTLIENMSSEVMATLTAHFDEPLVRTMIARESSNYAQRKIFRLVKNAYRSWKKDTDLMWGVMPYMEVYPNYMMNIQLDIECGIVLTDSEMTRSSDEKTNDVVDTSSGSGEEVKALKARNEKLEAELDSLKRLLHEESEIIQVADKIRLELLLRLMEKDGADLDDYGNKTNAAKVIQMVSGLPPSTCKNYCSNRDLNTKFHAESISKVNHALKELEMKTRL